MRVLVDGICVSGIIYGQGKTVTIDIDNNAHNVQASLEVFNGPDAFSERLEIPANDLDFGCVLRAERRFTWSDVARPTLILYENPATKSRNDIELKKRAEIEAVFNQIKKDRYGRNDYSISNSLSLEHRQTRYYQRIINAIKLVEFKNAVQYFCERVWDIRTVIWEIESLAGIPEFRNEIDYLLSNKSYFTPIDTSETNDGAIESVLPSVDTIDALNKLKTETRPDLKKSLLEDYNVILSSKNSDNLEELTNAIRLILRCDYSEEDFDELKRWLLCFGVFIESAGAKEASVYKKLQRANQQVFSPTVKVDNDYKLAKTVDMLIAEAVRCSDSKSFEEFDKDLEEFLKYTCPFRRVNKSQYDILLQIFAHIGAYEQEKMVLQAMVDNMIERTPEQEARLVFLRNNSLSIEKMQKFEETKQSTQEGSIVYEYRTLNWSENDIRDYFIAQSTNGTFNTDMPYVVAEWSKTINSSVTWEIEDIAKQIERELVDNYGDRLRVVTKKTGINSEWIEYSDTICIVEKDINNKEYRWIAFNVIGENITKKQIHIMIQALYWPSIDHSIMSLEDIYSKNAAVAKKVIALKSKHNPRWNIYIESVVNIVVSVIEKWINNGVGESIY